MIPAGKFSNWIQIYVLSVYQSWSTRLCCFQESSWRVSVRFWTHCLVLAMVPLRLVSTLVSLVLPRYVTMASHASQFTVNLTVWTKTTNKDYPHKGLIMPNPFQFQNASSQNGECFEKLQLWNALRKKFLDLIKIPLTFVSWTPHHYNFPSIQVFPWWWTGAKPFRSLKNIATRP